MYNYTVRFGGGNVANSGSSIFLQRHDGAEVQLQHKWEDFVRLKKEFPPQALDLVILSFLSYACDRSSSRDGVDETDDGWTRRIGLEVPVSDLQRWIPLVGKVEDMLSFLTGDEWHISFRQRTEDLFDKAFRKKVRGFTARKRVGGDAVSLFSGGMDSLIGVIDWLEQNPTKVLTLSGAYDAFAEPASDDQQNLLVHLKAAYSSRIHYIASRMGVTGKGEDSNYRSRSFCFITLGVMAAQFIGNGTKVLVPENGGIGLNYPLTPARSGSLSTRTVHPHFIALLQDLISSLGVICSVVNPFRHSTKGEMFAACRNQKLLQAAYPESMSCGNRKRFRITAFNKQASQCGFCVPCLFRRAALFRKGWNEGDYGVAVEHRAQWGTLDLADGNSNLEAVKDFVLNAEGDGEIWRRIVANGGVPLDEKGKYIDLVKRQRFELEAWLRGKGMIA
jgi:7-cyano-7-deazaguanine synthase in queuosine biosynthesis